VDAGEVDAGPPDGGAPPPPPAEVEVSGRVVKLGDHLAGIDGYAGNAAILAYGAPGPGGVPRSTVSAAGPQDTGAYRIRVPSNGQVVFVASRAGYHQTFTPVTTGEADLVDRRLYLAEAAWLAAIGAAHGVELSLPFACQTASLAGQQCFHGALVGRIVDDGAAGNGQVRPVAGVARADFTIRGGPAGAEWRVRGPYFLTHTGTPSPDAQASLVYQDGQGRYIGGLYVAFVEVPVVGPDHVAFELSIRTGPAGAYRYFGPTRAQVFRSPGTSVTWASIQETGLAPPGAPVDAVDFDSQVYPLFLPVNQGGLGCQGCHTDQGGARPAGGLNLYGGPEVAHAALDPVRYPQRVNVAAPDASLLLVRPLYEAQGPQDHPIFAFASPQDPAYRTLRAWIAAGAVREVPQAPVSFYREVRPLLYRPANQGGAGCYACHVAGVDAATAPGGFYMGGDGDALYEALVNVAPRDPGPYNEAYRINKAPNTTARSLVLTKPLFGNPTPHPVKIFFDATDPRYQLIYRWIAEGYANDTP
jgi:mono/diheme cytochrome c family protein